MSDCSKRRYQDRERAFRRARRIETAKGYPEGTLRPYRCPGCPFWHLTRARTHQRGRHGHHTTTDFRSIGARVAPGVIEALRIRVDAQ